ncbi:CLUMA_CG019896, isoform A [Clunio marinus]|uniref:CLUMA_CG019896, isoform A n=1 Tax=Clunio marinus TaxID=568069 RepID=A0A1J1J2F2_9DIPT|nr:CLUMA_CG019896, isoform A [Clunio marinus]
MNTSEICSHVCLLFSREFQKKNNQIALKIFLTAMGDKCRSSTLNLPLCICSHRGNRGLEIEMKNSTKSE